jgi:hypothetical protein
MYKNLSQTSDEIPNPISSYNSVIKQYNDPLNCQNRVILQTAYNNFIYARWYRFQSSHSILLMLMYFIPYLNALVLGLNLILVLMGELALRTSRKNKKKIENPLKAMIYEPSLCKNPSIPYLYFKVELKDLKSLNLGSHTEDRIIKRNEELENNDIQFMVYNHMFISGYYALMEYRYKSYSHLAFNIAIILLMNYFVYSQVFCFSLIKPLKFIPGCEISLLRSFSN